MGLPAPEPGLVLNYAYLWHDEYLAGQEEGRKNRPSVVLLCVTRKSDQSTIVTVLPITHSIPKDPAAGLEIPLGVKTHLGLDGERSWVVLSEGNEFVWPGYDLRRIPQTDEFAFGFLPPKFFERIQKALQAYHKNARLKTAAR